MSPAARHLALRAGLAAAVVALALADAALARRQAAERQASRRIGRLLTDEERQALAVAALSVRTPHGDDLLYGRVAGLWRCLDQHQALADGHALTRIVDQLLSAEGVMATDDVARAADYGFADGVAYTVRFHGPQVLAAPDRDVQLALEVGLPVPGLDGSYARRVGDAAIWAIDADPRPLLEAGGFPPLLDRHVLPSVWPPDGQVLARLDVARREGDGFAMHLRKLDLPPEELAPGVSPYRWIVQRADGTELVANPLLASSFVNYLRLAEFQAVQPFGPEVEAALEQPLGRLALQTAGGESLELLFGAPDADGRVPVANLWSRTVVAVGPDVASLLLPPAAHVLDGRVDNPWQPALERGAIGLPPLPGR